MNEDFKLLPQAPLSATNTAVDKKINAITPNEEYVPSTGRQLLGMGIEIGGGMISEVVAPIVATVASVPTLGAGAAPAYVGTKYSFGVASSYLAQIVEGHPEWRHGRAQFAGGANVVPFGNTVRKTKDGVKLASKVMAGRVTQTAAKGSLISTASITGERVIDDGRLPTLGELGFAATFGGALGAGFDIGSVKVGEKFLPVWDKMTDGMKGTFLKVAGKSPQEIREQITKGKISREEFRTLRDQLVDDAYKDAGFWDGFMGNKPIDVNSLKPSQRLDYVKNRLQYLDELNEDIIDNLEDGIIDVKEFRAQTKPIVEEIQALRLREEELTKLARETPTVKPEAERPVSPEEVIEEAVDEIDEPTPRQTPEGEAPSTNRDAEYERLVKEDPEAAKQMLRDEAEANGYDTEAFHGTHSEGIKEFAGGTHFGSKGAASKRNADVRNNIEVERDNTLSSLTKQNPTISKYFDVENDADVQAIYQKYRDKYRELDTDGDGFGGIGETSKPVPKELIDIQNETDALILQKLKEGLKKQKDDLEIERQKALEGANTPKLKAKVNEVYDDLIKRDTEVSESLIKNYEEGVNSLTRGSTVMPVFIKTGNVKRTVDVEGVDEMGNPIEGGSRSITDDFEEGVNTLQYTNKFEGDESFVIKDSEQAKSGELIVTDKDGNIIPLSQRFKGQEAPATPKETPAPTPEPTEKERIIELAEQLMGRKDILDAAGNKVGLGNRVAVEKTEELTNAFGAYRNKVLEPLKQMVQGGDYDADELIKLLDDYAEIAPAKFEVDNKDGGVLAIRREDRTADQFQKVISERKQAEVDAINDMRDMVKRAKDEPLDVDNLESLRKRVMGEVDDEIPTTGGTEGSGNKPKLTPQQSRTASLEKQLAREQEIFTGQRDPSDPKAPVTSPRIRELEAQIKFYRTASNEAAEVAELQEKNKLLYAMVSGQDVAKIDETLGIHPKFRPDYANKKKMDGHLEFLRQQNKRLQEKAREAQRDAALAQADRVINPDRYAKSSIDRGIDMFEEVTTGWLLGSTLTGTAGLFANTVAMLGRPIRDTLGGRLWRNLPLKEKRIYRQALYRLADIISYKDVATGFLSPSNIKNMFGAATNRGQNPMFPQARVRYDETTQKPRLQNQRAIDKARKRQQRRDEGDGLNNALLRIKAAETLGDTFMELSLFGRTMLGVFDVPFANAITKSRLYSEALRDAIRNEAPDIQAHVAKYIDEAYKMQNGRKVWAYKERDLDIMNEYREALLMPRDLKDGDIRKTVIETMIEKVDAQTGSGTAFGRMVQLLFPIRTTGAIATGQIISKVGAPLVAAGKYGTKGLAKLAPESTLLSGTAAGQLQNTTNNVARYRKILREGVDDKGVALTKESEAKIRDQLTVEETRLAKLKTQMEEVDRKVLGNLAMFTAFWLYYWNLSDEEGITGSGAHLSVKQRKDSNFQSYKMLFDDGDTMVDYRMADPDKAVVAFIADTKAYLNAAKNNQTVEGQSLMKTWRRSAYQILTDNPFMTGYRNVSTILDSEEDEDRWLKAMISIMTSRFQPPSMVRHINQLDDTFVPDHTQSRLMTMTTDRMFGSAPVNVRRYETGSPMYLPEKEWWNLSSRSAPTTKVPLSYQEVYDILEEDGRRTNIVGGLAPTQKGIKTKDYWNEDGQTLYDAFGEFIYTYYPTKPIKVGKKSLRNLRLEEAMYDIITDPSWDDKYKDGKISNVDTDGYMYAEDFFDSDGNIKNANDVTNKGLQELQDVRLAYVRAARKEFFKRETLEKFKNTDGLTPSQEVARISNEITE